MIKIILILFLFQASLAQTPIEKGVVFFSEKKFNEALKVFKSVNEGQAGYADAQYYLGRISFNDKKWDEAVEYLEKAVGINNKVADYHYWLGNSYGSQAQESNFFKQGILAPKVKSEFEKTVQLDPQNTDAYHGLIDFYSQAPGVMGGSWEKAHECADQIKKLKPAEGCRAKANIYVRQENFSGAETEWKNAVKADPNVLPSLISFYSSQKKYNAAFQELDAALKKDPDNMMNIYQYGRTSAMSGERLDQGAVYLKKYLNYTPKENEPSIAGANMRLAQIMEKKGDKNEARKRFQLAHKLDPNLKEAKEGVERLK